MAKPFEDPGPDLVERPVAEPDPVLFVAGLHFVLRHVELQTNADVQETLGEQLGLENGDEKRWKRADLAAGVAEARALQEAIEVAEGCKGTAERRGRSLDVLRVRVAQLKALDLRENQGSVDDVSQHGGQKRRREIGAPGDVGATRSEEDEARLGHQLGQRDDGAADLGHDHVHQSVGRRLGRFGVRRMGEKHERADERHRDFAAHATRRVAWIPVLRLSLATKIFLGFSALLGIFALLAWLSVLEIRSVSEELRTIDQGPIALARLSARLETHNQNRIRDLQRVLSDTDPQRRRSILNVAAQYVTNTLRSVMDEIREVSARQVERTEERGGEISRMQTIHGRIDARLSEIEEYHQALDALTQRLREVPAEQLDVDAAAATLADIERDLRGATFQLNTHIKEATDIAVFRTERELDRAVIRIAIMTIVGLFVGLFLTVLAARSLAPIRRLVVYARAISRGDYEQSIQARGSEELVQLAEELEQMARSRKSREEELDRQADELEEAYRRVEDLKRFHESIVRSLRTGVVVTDRALTLTSTNRAAKTHWALDGVEGEALATTELGRAMAERLGPLARYVENPDTVTTAALPLGEQLADVTIAPLENERGAVLGLVIALEDVTEAVQTKKALIRSERLATIGRMSAHVTHEIRNPLSSIGINAEMLEDLSERSFGEDNAEAKDMCRAIAREVDRLTAITEAYLKFARLPRPELSDEDLGTWLAGIAAFVRRDLDAANITLDLSIPSPAPTVRIDPDQMRQALLNLVRNAKESMPEGGSVALEASIDDDKLEIRVRDEGSGIPADHLERVFDPFYSTKQTGTGLGLALTQQIVQEHGGRLKLHSEVGSGTEFVIALPLGQTPGISHVFEEDEQPAAKAS